MSKVLRKSIRYIIQQQTRVPDERGRTRLKWFEQISSQSKRKMQKEIKIFRQSFPQCRYRLIRRTSIDENAK